MVAAPHAVLWPSFGKLQLQATTEGFIMRIKPGKVV